MRYWRRAWATAGFRLAAPPCVGTGPAADRPLALLGGVLVKSRTKVLGPPLVLPVVHEYARR